MIAFEHLERFRRTLAAGRAHIRLAGLTGSAKAFFLAQALKDVERPVLFILPERREAQEFYRDLLFFHAGAERPDGPGIPEVLEFPPYDLSPLTGLSPPPDLLARRVEALYALSTARRALIVTCLEAVMFRTLPKDALLEAVDYVVAQEEVAREDLVRRLEANGFQRCSLVEEKGDYAVRGGVIDIYPPLYPDPLRLEFWGDRLESIRTFDPASQRSLDALEEAIILPAAEIIATPAAVKRARSMGRLPAGGESGAGFPGQESWLNHFYSHLNTLFEYLPATGLTIAIDPERLATAYARLRRKIAEERRRFQGDAAAKGAPFPELAGILLNGEELTHAVRERQSVDIEEVTIQPCTAEDILVIPDQHPVEADLELNLAARGKISLAPLAQKIIAWMGGGGRMVLVSRTEQQAGRLREILAGYEVHADQTIRDWRELPTGPGLTLFIGRLSHGFRWPALGLYLISEDELFGPKSSRAQARKRVTPQALDWTGFSQLKAGDFVVHEEHGIGRYAGLLKLEVADRINDFVLVEYAANDRLYIPADRVSVLQKYAGLDEKDPKLDQLGGHTWASAKQKAKKHVEQIARQLVDLYALRKYRTGHAFLPPDADFREFETTFGYEETPDQAKAIEDVLDDLQAERPMDRLICGDVGFGKTEIAMRAAFKVVSDGRQVGLLVPTTVLAEQHYETFRQRMTAYPFRIGILSRFKTRAEQTETLKALRAGELDIVVGTHRLLQKDVKFRNLGLLIVDEEQRFGVRQKEELKRYRSLVDVLALTATPVPRTLYMSLMGIRDLSVIETPPADRQSIETYLARFDEQLVQRAIEFEIQRGGQVFFVHNRVRTIDTMAADLMRVVPKARLAVAHGQMHERDLEEAMLRFLHREIDVLVCSTIIESGLDIPSANTIIINEVERLGLAQIYQLRGRVGRSQEKAYAYLLFSRDAVLARDAEKRLRALMDFSHLGAGLNLAMHDLKIRGGGNILGFTQSGHIAAVGYDLYFKLIEQAVAELKGEEWEEDINPEINMDLPAYMPEAYVQDTDVRLNLYRRLSCLKEMGELARIQEEIRDRFGSPPPQVRNLLGVMRIRLRLKQIGATRLTVGPHQAVLWAGPRTTLTPGHVLGLIERQTRTFRFLAPDRLEIRLKSGPAEVTAVLAEVERRLGHLADGAEGSGGAS